MQIPYNTPELNDIWVQTRHLARALSCLRGIIMEAVTDGDRNDFTTSLRIGDLESIVEIYEHYATNLLTTLERYEQSLEPPSKAA